MAREFRKQLFIVLVFVGVIFSGCDTPPVSGWNGAYLIENNATQNAWDAKVYSDNNGHAFAIWLQSDGTNTSVYVNRADDVNGLAGAVPIENDNNTATEPSMAFDSAGNGIAVWMYKATGGTAPFLWSVKANFYDASTGTWGTAFDLESDNTYSVLYPQAVFAPNGDAMVIWEHSDIPYVSGFVSGEIGRIEAVYYDVSQPQGSRWSAPMPVSNNDTRAASWPKIGFDGNGDAIAIWCHDETDPGLYQDVGNVWNLWSNRFTAGTPGSWGTPELIETNTGPNINHNKIAVSSNGDAIAVWRQNDTTTFTDDVWYNHYVSGSGWGTADVLDTSSLSTSSPSVAIDDTGNAMVVWEQLGSGGGKHIWGRYFNVSSGWQGASIAETATTNTFSGSPQVALAGNGIAFVVWMMSDGVYNAYANRFEYGQGWGSSQPLETSNTAASFPRVIADSNGNAVTVWYQKDTSNIAHIWGNLYLAQ